jgi:PAS domain S-box-containing protein
LAAQSQEHPRQAGESETQYIHRLQTELTRVQTSLNEDHLKIQAMLNNLGEGLIATDSHGVITMVNLYAATALGFAEHELIGTWFPKTIIAVDPYSQAVDPMSRPIIKALTTGQTVSSYAHYLTKTGAVMPVHLTISAIVINGVPSGAIEVFRDLTKEQQLDIAKEEFVSLASHQLRTPATAVKSILSMLSSGDFGAVSELQRKYLDKATDSNNHQLQVIEDLLNVALVDAGKLELDPEYEDIVPIIRDSVAEHLSTIKTRKQNLVLDTPSQLKLLIDVRRLRMAIDNLISNASKYSPPEGKIGITVSRVHSHVKISVSDQGVGIPPDEQSRLFTKFSRLPNELSANVGGTGLGLFLTKSIVELHNGTIDVDSEPGLGSTFTIGLPTKWSTN